MGKCHDFLTVGTGNNNLEGKLKMFDQIRSFFVRFRGETLIAVVTSIVVWLVTRFIDNWSTLAILVAIFCCRRILLLFAILFNLKRLFKSRLEMVDRIMIDYFGFSWRENQYFKRLQHFVDEKKFLARVLVEQFLPKLVDRICADNPKVHIINIILDSGTTITPVFSHLIRLGIPTKEGVEINILTNNLAGIDEIHKIDISKKDALSERDFNLIGGQPLNNYRATTGDFTHKILEDLWKQQRDSGGKIVSLGIITANWFLAGRGLDRIQICARGAGHFAYKVSIIKNCEQIVLVGPLGKILPFDHVDELNALTSAEKSYDASPLPEAKRNETYLLTSYRPKISLSPLRLMSNMLVNVCDRGNSKNFIFCPDNPTFDPKQNNRLEAIITELPHEYVRDNFKTVYGYELIEE